MTLFKHKLERRENVNLLGIYWKAEAWQRTWDKSWDRNWAKILAWQESLGQWGPEAEAWNGNLSHGFKAKRPVRLERANNGAKHGGWGQSTKEGQHWSQLGLPFALGLAVSGGYWNKRVWSNVYDLTSFKRITVAGTLRGNTKWHGLK